MNAGYWLVLSLIPGSLRRYLIFKLNWFFQSRTGLSIKVEKGTNPAGSRIWQYRLGRTKDHSRISVGTEEMVLAHMATVHFC